jgi:hypothetical protein
MGGVYLKSRLGWSINEWSLLVCGRGLRKMKCPHCLESVTNRVPVDVSITREFVLGRDIDRRFVALGTDAVSSLFEIYFDFGT